MLIYRYFPAITLATWGLMLASMPAWPIDCARWAAEPQCLPAKAAPVAKRMIRRIKKFTVRRATAESRGGVESRHAKTGNMPGAAPGAEESSPASRLVRAESGGTAWLSRAGVAPGPRETLMYRQIVPLPVATSPEPRIIPLPSRMPDLSSRNIVADHSPIIPPRAVSWTRSRDGIAAIMLGVAAIYIAFVAYACVPHQRGKSHEPARHTTARRRRFAFRHRPGTGTRKTAPQPARHEPHFA